MRPLSLIPTAVFVLILSGCDHKEEEHEVEHPREVKPEPPKEGTVEERQQQDKREKEEIEALKKDIEDLRERLKAHAAETALWKMTTEQLIKDREAGNDEVKRRQIVRVLISRIENGTERAEVRRILGEPFKTIDDRDYYLEFDPSKFTQSADYESYCTSLLFEHDRLKNYRVIHINENNPTEQLVKLRHWETDDSRRLIITQHLSQRVKLGTLRLEVHRLIGEPLSSSKDSDYYPDDISGYVREIGGLSHSHEVQPGSFRTRFDYDDDKLKGKTREKTPKDLDAVRHSEDAMKTQQ